MSCIISRDESGVIQAVQAPNEMPSNLYRDALSFIQKFNDPTVNPKEYALRVWARAYTSGFKAMHGNWELVSEARKYVPKMQGIYKTIFNNDPQRALHEASIQANSSVAERKGAVSAFGERVVKIAEELYPKAQVGEEFEPAINTDLALDENSEPNLYSMLTKDERNRYNQFENIKKHPNEEGNLREAVEDIAKNGANSYFREIAKFLLNHDLGKNVFERLPDAMSGGSTLGRIHRIEGTTKMQVYILPGNIKSNFPEHQYRRTEDQAILHETVHLLTLDNMADHPETVKEIQKLMDHAKKNSDIESKFPYPFTAPHEFVAEAFTNPEFQVALKNISYEKSNAWQEFLHLLYRVLDKMSPGYEKNSLLEKIMEVSTPLFNPMTTSHFERSSSADIALNLSQKMGIEFVEDTSLKQPGAVIKGVVHYNPNMLSPDTLLHEFMHPFVEAIRISNPKLFKNLSARAGNFMYKDKNISDFVKEHNPELKENSIEFQSEVITTAIGLEAAFAGSVNDKNNPGKFLAWLNTLFEKIAEYFNKLMNDSDMKIRPEDLDINMSIGELAQLLNMDNQIDLGDVNMDELYANQIETLAEIDPEVAKNIKDVDKLIEDADAAGALGSRENILFFENREINSKLVEEPDGSTHYENGTMDAVTKLFKKFSRLTERVSQQFVPDVKSGKKRLEKFNEEKYYADQASKIFTAQNKSLTETVTYKNSPDFKTFDEVKELIKKEIESYRIKGKIMHKMIEGFIRAGKAEYYIDEINALREEGNLSESELSWFGNALIKKALGMAGLNGKDFGKISPEFRDNIASEFVMTSDVLNIGTAFDGWVEHPDGSNSFVDFKTGPGILRYEESGRRLLYNDGLTNKIDFTTLNIAKLEVVMRMVMAKLNKPDLKVRDLKIVILNRDKQTEIRKVEVQEYLDYIENNYRLTIRDLEKEIKAATGPEVDVLRDELKQKQKEFKAMIDGNIFEFRNYHIAPGYSEVVTGKLKVKQLSQIKDPEDQREWVYGDAANEAREAIAKGRKVDTPTMKRIKGQVYSILNYFKPANITSVETEGRKDIGYFSARGGGFRNHKNAFLQAFSVLFETATEKVMKLTESFLGEQSDFRKADRALKLDHMKRTGQSAVGGLRNFSYSTSNAPVTLSNQGVFDFMYTWKDVSGELMRIGAVYTEEDFKKGTISKAQWDYYQAVKATLKYAYEGVLHKVAYMRGNIPVTYGQLYKSMGISFANWSESFLPKIPFQNSTEIAERNLIKGEMKVGALVKEAWENYRDRYDLSIQNEQRTNIGIPLKYMSRDNFLSGDNHSFDVTKAVDVFTRHMIGKAELDDVYFIGRGTLAIIEDPENLEFMDKNGDTILPDTALALKSFLNQHILGRRKMTLNYFGRNKPKLNKSVDRFVDNLRYFISAKVFWFAPIPAFFNSLYGLLTNGKEGLIGSLAKRLYGSVHEITNAEMRKAGMINGVTQWRSLTTYSNIKRNLIKEEFAGEYYKDKVKYMVKIFRLGNRGVTYSDDALQLAVRMRLGMGDNGYLLQGLSEDLTNEVFVTASLLARKIEVKSVDANGNEVIKYLKKDGTYTLNPKEKNLENMWDAYKMNDATKEYEYTGPTRFMDKDGNEVKGITMMESLKVKTYLERIYGAYSPEQRSHMERYAGGKALMQFRKFQIMNIRENFTLNSAATYMGDYKQMFNPDGTPKLKDGQPMYEWHAELQYNRWKAFTHMAMYFFKHSGKEDWDKLSVENKKQAVRFATQLVFYGLTIAMAGGAFIPPDKKETYADKRWLRFMEDMTVVHPMNVLEGATTIDSYPELLYKGAQAVGTFTHSLMTDDRIQSGKYVGDYKGSNTLENYIPVVHPINQTISMLKGE